MDTNNSKSFARCSAFIHIKQGIEAAIVANDADTSWLIAVSWRQKLQLDYHRANIDLFELILPVDIVN